MVSFLRPEPLPKAARGSYVQGIGRPIPAPRCSLNEGFFTGVGQAFYRVRSGHPEDLSYFLMVRNLLLLNQGHSPEEDRFGDATDEIVDSAQVFLDTGYAAGFFFHFAKGSRVERLTALQLPLGQRPIVVAFSVYDENFVAFGCLSAENTASGENHVFTCRAHLFRSHFRKTGSLPSTTRARSFCTPNDRSSGARRLRRAPCSAPLAAPGWAPSLACGLSLPRALGSSPTIPLFRVSLMA